MTTRRNFLYGLGTSIGSVALSAMLADQASAETTGTDRKSAGPLSPKHGHFPAKAKNCIFLMMEGGPSHIDTFDPKPSLSKMHLKEFTREGEQKTLDQIRAEGSERLVNKASGSKPLVESRE